MAEVFCLEIKKNICAYQRLIRTNNDAEGYHFRINKKYGTQPPSHKMVDGIYHEARKVDITCKLVSSQAVSLTTKKEEQGCPLSRQRYERCGTCKKQKK